MYIEAELFLRGFIWGGGGGGGGGGGIVYNYYSVLFTSQHAHAVGT